MFRRHEKTVANCNKRQALAPTSETGKGLTDTEKQPPLGFTKKTDITRYEFFNA